MLRIPGAVAKDLCDPHLKPSRRDFLRVGGAGMLGMSLSNILAAQSASANSPLTGKAGWGKAKSVIMIYLQGGPSHLDLWDPKPESPDNVRSIFKPIPTKVDGCQYTEILPKLAPDDDTYAVLLTHDPKIDDVALHILLKSDAAYIGALGSKKTHAKRVNRLQEAGFTEAEIGRIHGPVGLSIGAKTPEEVALSIIGQIVKVKRERQSA